MTGFLCKQVEPYLYVYNTETAAATAETAGVLILNSTNTASVASMSLNIVDDSGLNRLSWIESFFTSTLTGRDLLTMTYKTYGEQVTVSTITTSPTVVTTDVAHNFSTGDVVSFTGGATSLNNGNFSITKTSDTTFTVGTHVATAGSGGTVFALGNYTTDEVIFEITGTAASTTSGYATVELDWVSGDLPSSDDTDVTLSFNKAGLVGSRFWYGNCTRVQEGLGLCSSTNGAFVPAVTVCKQEL